MYTKVAGGDLTRSVTAPAGACLGERARPAWSPRSLGEVEVLRAGTILYRQDDPASHLYRLVDGMVGTFLLTENGGRRVTGFLSEGDYFGSVFSGRYRSSAQAITECTVFRMSRRDWPDGDLSDPPHGRIVLDAMESELRVAEDHVLLLGGVTACARVAAFLLYLSKRAARRGEPDNPVSIPMTRYDIADFLGTTSESVSRCLTKLKQSGAIGMDAPDRITLIDRRALSDIPRGY